MGNFISLCIHKMLKFLIAVCAILLSWNSTSCVSAVCCDSNKGTCPPFKGTCPTLDGCHFCCGKGACNIFCCNCGGGACLEDRSHRSHKTVKSKGMEAMKMFNAVDTDGNLKISLDEALVFHGNETGKSSGGLQRPKWFSDIDIDGDGIISPNEFDSDISF